MHRLGLGGMLALRLPVASGAAARHHTFASRAAFPAQRTALPRAAIPLRTTAAVFRGAPSPHSRRHFIPGLGDALALMEAKRRGEQQATAAAAAAAEDGSSDSSNSSTPGDANADADADAEKPKPSAAAPLSAADALAAATAAEPELAAMFREVTHKRMAKDEVGGLYKPSPAAPWLESARFHSVNQPLLGGAFEAFEVKNRFPSRVPSRCFRTCNLYRQDAADLEERARAHSGDVLRRAREQARRSMSR
jgi:hypothetical protein